MLRRADLILFRRMLREEINYVINWHEVEPEASAPRLATLEDILARLDDLVGSTLDPRSEHEWIIRRAEPGELHNQDPPDGDLEGG